MLLGMVLGGCIGFSIATILAVNVIKHYDNALTEEIRNNEKLKELYLELADQESSCKVLTKLLEKWEETK